MSISQFDPNRYYRLSNTVNNSTLALGVNETEPPSFGLIGLAVPQNIVQTSTAAMVLSVNRAKKAKKVLENIYCCVWYVSIGSEPGCIRLTI